MSGCTNRLNSTSPSAPASSRRRAISAVALKYGLSFTDTGEQCEREHMRVAGDLCGIEQGGRGGLCLVNAAEIPCQAAQAVTWIIPSRVIAWRQLPDHKWFEPRTAKTVRVRLGHGGPPSAGTSCGELRTARTPHQGFKTHLRASSASAVENTRHSPGIRNPKNLIARLTHLTSVTSAAFPKK
jgi:hypothetical protein